MQVDFISRCDVLICEGSSRVSVFSSVSPLSLFDMLLATREKGV
jgi:uncharacterized membrane protein YcjF (UPF0283 family)